MKFIFLILLASVLINCSNSSPIENECEPNYKSDNYELLVAKQVDDANTYLIKVCDQFRDNNNTISVFGVSSADDISSLDASADFRLEHIEDVNDRGDSFEVTFADNDAWFVIFEDDDKGEYSTATELIRGELR